MAAIMEFIGGEATFSVTAINEIAAAPIVELNEKGQLTLPAAIVEKFNWLPGDRFRLVSRNGEFYCVPLAVYPPKFLDKLARQSARIKNDIQEGKLKGYTDIDEMFAAMDKEAAAMDDE